MFEKGTYMVYGNSGVCLVQDICSSPFDKTDTRTYYILKPVYGHGTALIYTPVDNDRVTMRPLLSSSEAQRLIERIPDIPALSVEVEKLRREMYRTVLGTACPDAYVSLMKAVLRRRADYAGLSRRLPDFETECDNMARRHLYTELSVVLEIPFAEIEQYLRGRVESQI